MSILSSIFQRSPENVGAGVDWDRLSGPDSRLRMIEGAGLTAEEHAALNPRLQAIIRPQAFDRWRGLSSRGLEPEGIQEILDGAFSGDLSRQWELFDLMEDTWPRLSKNLNELKRAVADVGFSVMPFQAKGAKPTPSAQERADFIEQQLWNWKPKATADENAFEGMLYDLCDAVGKGTSVQEIFWDLKDGVVTPRATKFVPGRYYGFPHDSNELHLTPEGYAGNWIPFPEHKFILGTFKTKSGHMIGTAMLRKLAMFWLGANFSYEWALNFAQLYGIPMRWATYDPAQPGLLEKVSSMLENMGSASWGAFPAGTTMEIKEAVKNSGNTPHGYLLDIADLAADLLVLGQTLTSTAGDKGSQALGKVHYAVRADIIGHVASWAANVINYQLIPSIALLNYGDTEELPWIKPQIEEPVDEKALVERDKILFSEMGLPVARQYLYERHSVPVPSAEDELFEPSRPTPPAQPGLPPVDMSKVQAKGLPAGSQDRLLDAVMEELTGVQARWTAPVRDIWEGVIAKLRDETLTDEEVATAITAAANRMPELFGKLPATDEVRDLMERAMGTAIVEGATRREDAVIHASEQPRVPAGSADGGQFASTGGGSTGAGSMPTEEELKTAGVAVSDNGSVKVSKPKTFDQASKQMEVTERLLSQAEEAFNKNPNDAHTALRFRHVAQQHSRALSNVRSFIADMKASIK